MLVINALNFLVGIFPFLRRKPWTPCDYEIYRRKPLTSWSRPYDVVVGLAADGLFVLAYVPLLALASALYLLALLPDALIFPKWLRVLVVKLVSVLVESAGDQYALMYTETAASSVRQRLIDVMRPFMDEQNAGEEAYDTACVISHSGGATVAFSALSDPELWREWTGSPEPPVDMTLFTVGSSLTIANENVPEHPMWDSPLPKNIAWIDVWARYDWAPHGPPSRELAQKVHGSEGRFCTVRVVNLDSVFGDHSAYWKNYEEVVSRLVYEIAGRPQPAQGPGQTTSEAQVRAAVEKAIERIPGHRRRIGAVSFARVAIIAALAVIGGLFGGGFAATGSFVLSRIPETDTWPQPLSWLVGAIPSVVLEFVVGFVLFVLLVHAVWRLILLWLGPVLYKDPWGESNRDRENI